MANDKYAIELLAPAGDWECLRAACANGANAVYFGLSAFNARHRAANFTPGELPDVIEFLHARNVRGYVTLNTLIFSDELDDAVCYVRLIAAAGADGVIVQDLGLARLIAELAPGLSVHASTQMTMTEPRAIEWAREKLHIRRVILARELSVADIQKTAVGTNVPLEVFVHGALCVAYSGQCLTSEALGGRSANRGQCAQACRLPYELVADGVVRDLGDRAYLLSPTDLAGHSFVADMIAAGVISFKIEGRLKTPHYVAATTATYRTAIDTALEAQTFVLPKQLERDLQQTFSRGFTPGFLGGTNHQQLVRGRFPKSRGLHIGTVVAASRNGVRVRLDDDDPSLLVAGDGVVFDLGLPEDKEPGGRIWSIREQRTSSTRRDVELAFEAGAFDLTAIPPGASVWKTDDPGMKRRLENSYSTDPIVHREFVDVQLHGTSGGPLHLLMHSRCGLNASATWPGPIEAARQHPTSSAEIRTQLDRLGDTPFALGEVSCDLPGNSLIPRSVLNDLRRRAIGELLGKRRDAQRIEFSAPNALAHWRQQIEMRTVNHSPRTSLSVLVRTADQLNAALAGRPDLVHCDFEDPRRYRDAVALARQAGVPIGLATLRILKPGEEGLLKTIVSAEPDLVLVRCLGAMLYLRQHAAHIAQIGDFSLNVANELTADLLMSEGFVRLVPSYDLNWEQFSALIRRCRADWFEAVIHQHMPMFHMEHCVFAAFMSTGKDWRDCGRPCDRHRIELRDRVGAAFPVVPDAGCRNTVFNSVPQSAAEYVAQMQALGVRHFRLDLLRESAAEVGTLLQSYRRVLDGQEHGRETWRKLRAMNQLGVTRGTLQLI